MRRNAREERLNQYLDSLGEELPPDLYEYERGTKLQHECVFCGKTHEFFVTHKYDPYRLERKLTGAMHCADCAAYVDSMVSINYEELWQYDMHNTFESQSEGKVRYDDDPGKGARIKQYNTTLTFDHTVYRHYRYLKKEIDTYAEPLSCYFCKNAIALKRLVINTPIEVNSTLSGGNIYCCDECSYDLRTIPEMGEDDYYITQRCPRCTDFYPVAADEMKARQDSGTIGTHYCPECAYMLINNIDDNSLYYYSQNHKSRTFPPERFMFIDCVKCQGTQVIDITIVEAEHLGYWDKDKKEFYCPVCAKNKDAIILVYSKEIRIIVDFKDPDGYSYSIWQQSNYKTHKLYESIMYEDEILCTITAFEECEKLLTDPQLKLWDDQ